MWQDGPLRDSKQRIPEVGFPKIALYDLFVNKISYCKFVTQMGMMLLRIFSQGCFCLAQFLVDLLSVAHVLKNTDNAEGRPSESREMTLAFH